MGLGFRAWGLGFRGRDLGLGIECLTFRFFGFRFTVSNLGRRV